MTPLVILAGGLSRRMGKDKTELPYKGGSFVSNACESFSPCFAPVLLSVRERGKFSIPGAREIVDVYTGCGPMAGLHAALKAGCWEVFLMAADLPLATPALALRICELGEGYDACVLLSGEGSPEPLFAWYSREALAPAEELLSSGEYKMLKLLERLNVRYVNQFELPEYRLSSVLVNVNTPQDYENLPK